MKKTQKSKNTENKKSYNIELIPLIFALGFIPLIVLGHVYDSGFEAYIWFPASDDGIMFDFFNYFKASAIIITAVCMVIIAVMKKMYPKKDAILILLGLYGLCVLLSGLFSPFRKAAFAGSAELFESVPVILCYIVFFLYASMIPKDQTDVKKIIRYSSIGVFIISLISLLQFLNIDPFKWEAVKYLISPIGHREIADSISFTFGEHVAYATLYNTNYLSQYFGFVLFIGISLAMCSAVSKKYRIFAGVLALLSILALASSYSKTGLIAVALTGIFYIGMTAFDLVSNRRKNLPLLLFSLAALISFILFFVLRFEGFDKLKDRFISSADHTPDHAVSRVVTEDDCVYIDINSKRIRLSYETDGENVFIDMFDEKGTPLAFELSKDGMSYVLNDPELEGSIIYSTIIEEKICMAVETDGITLIFFNAGPANGGYLYYNKAGHFTKFKAYEKSSLFPDSLFSNRGELWNYIIKNLRSPVIFGSGANTFVYTYPNDDDLSKLYPKDGFVYYDVKAHSLYLQQLVENGLLSLIFFLVFYILYFVRSVRIYFRSDRRDFSFCLGKGIFLGSIVYMITGFTADSNVNTAPLFWILLGLGSVLIFESGDVSGDSLRE